MKGKTFLFFLIILNFNNMFKKFFLPFLILAIFSFNQLSSQQTNSTKNLPFYQVTERILNQSITTPLISDNILTFMIQDFEGNAFPPAGWTLGAGASIWGRSTSCSGYGNGTASAKADFYSVQSGTQDLISLSMAPTSGTDSLVFDHAYATYQTENDQMGIYYSTNGGTSWTLLIQLAGGVSGPLVTAPPTTSSFVPTAGQWATKRYLLPAGVNKVKFTGITAYGNNLYIDNIKVGTPYSNDVALISIDAPLPGMLPGSVVPKATVKNYGTSTQSFAVTFKINSVSYTATQNVTNLAPNATQQVTFSSVSLNTVGSYPTIAYTQLATDQDKSNDTTRSSTFVSTSARNLLLEYCTGTWCQWCPCGKTTGQQLETTYPGTVILAYHGPANGTDPMSFFNGNGILASMSMSAYPTGTIDRQNEPGSAGYDSWMNLATARKTNSPVTPISLTPTNKTYNPTTKELSVTYNVTPLVNLNGQYKINFVITEENIVYNQTGNSTCPGSSSYVHHWVVRNMVNGATGENVNTNVNWNANETVTKTFTTTINSAWVDNNCNFQAFVYKDASPLYTAEIQQVKRNSVTGPLEVTNAGTEIPVRYELNQNYPNPFNPSTNIKFSVPKAGFATFKIFDITGKEVSTELNEFIQAGYYNAVIDGTKLTSGIYFYTLTVNNFSETKKMVLIK
jgi:hypothetical protein